MTEVTVYSDYVCPYCFLEMPALERLEREEGVQVRWKAFELRPEPVPTLDPRGEYLVTTWRDSVYPLAARLGIPIQLPPVQPRSRLAFEGAEHAKEEDRFREYNEAVFSAFFQHGLDIGSPEVLTDVAREVRLDPERFATALLDHRYLERVLAQEEEARELGVYGVPTVAVGDRLIFSTVPYEELREAVRTAAGRREAVGVRS